MVTGYVYTTSDQHESNHYVWSTHDLNKRMERNHNFKNLHSPLYRHLARVASTGAQHSEEGLLVLQESPLSRAFLVGGPTRLREHYRSKHSCNPTQDGRGEAKRATCTCLQRWWTRGRV